MKASPPHKWPQIRISPTQVEKLRAVRASLGSRSETASLDGILTEFFSLVEADVPTFGPIVTQLRDTRKLSRVEAITDRDTIYEQLARINRELGIEDTPIAAEDPHPSARKRPR